MSFSAGRKYTSDAIRKDVHRTIHILVLMDAVNLATLHPHMHDNAGQQVGLCTQTLIC